MIKDIWINLPVKNVARSKEFFSKLGFEFNTQFGNSPDSACLLMGDKKTVVMLFAESAFEKFTRTKNADTNSGSEVLFSVSAESMEEVDQIAKKAEEAGGKIFGEPGEKDGWLYGCGFADLDGHRWNVLFMDFCKMPTKK